MGIPIAHSLVHAVEASGVAVALVSTAAATVGEVISTRALLAAERENERRRVDAAAAAAVDAINRAAGLGRGDGTGGEGEAVGGSWITGDGEEEEEKGDRAPVEASEVVEEIRRAAAGGDVRRRRPRGLEGADTKDEL